MTGMEEVLAAHMPAYRWSSVHNENVWACSTYFCEALGDFQGVIRHQAQELAKAGYGSQHDAWADGAEALTDHWANEQYEPHSNGNSDPPANPYPAPKVSES